MISSLIGGELVLWDVVDDARCAVCNPLRLCRVPRYTTSLLLQIGIVISTPKYSRDFGNAAVSFATDSVRNLTRISHLTGGRSFLN